MELRENPIHMATIPTTATLIQTLRSFSYSVPTPTSLNTATKRLLLVQPLLLDHDNNKPQGVDMLINRRGLYEENKTASERQEK